MKARVARLKRVTRETNIVIRLNLDGRGRAKVDTGIPFFNHMLELFARHGMMDLTLKAKGDLEVDLHHTVEDCGIVLGEAFNKALGDRKGIRRYGTGFDPRNPMRGESYVPMDETLVRCVIDFGGRPYLVWKGFDSLAYKRLTREEKTQDPACAFRFGLAREFFQGFVNHSRCNLHIELLYGHEPHHIVEAVFKAFGRAVDEACRRDPRISNQIPSTKGRLI
jgi:imidazoleglycerol-phosphate dehydratase